MRLPATRKLDGIDAAIVGIPFDSGTTWTYCDTDAGAGSDGSEDGYQSANAGSLEVTGDRHPR